MKIEILKEGATSIYGSDAIAGVINFFTIKKFDGFKVKIGSQTTSNYDQMIILLVCCMEQKSSMEI